MHDKELDDMFRNKLGRLEVTPEDKVWRSITLELDDVKPLDNFWNSILIVVVIAILFACFMAILINNNGFYTGPTQTIPLSIVDKQNINYACP